MIDINELRKLAQAALVAPDGLSAEWMDRLGQFQESVSPAAITELLDRLEAAEAEALEQARLNGMGSEREAALIAKLEAAERDRATFITEIGNMCTKVEALREELSKQQSLSQAAQQPAPVENDKSVRKAWARFSNELHRSPDAPYPGMSEAFEHHFSQSFTDREWRAESGTWAAAWKAAKHHARASAQAQPAPSVPDDVLRRALLRISEDGWLRAVDEALVLTDLGVANAEDSYETARRKLNEHICWHVAVALDPAVSEHATASAQVALAGVGVSLASGSATAYGPATEPPKPV